MSRLCDPRPCCKPGCKKESEERYSLGIYAGYYCDQHWKESGYRDEGPGGLDPMDAGESYEPID